MRCSDVDHEQSIAQLRTAIDKLVEADSVAYLVDEGVWMAHWTEIFNKPESAAKLADSFIAEHTDALPTEDTVLPSASVGAAAPPQQGAKAPPFNARHFFFWQVHEDRHPGAGL